MDVVGGQCDVEAGGKQDGACHGQQVEHTSGGGTGGGRVERLSLCNVTFLPVPPTHSTTCTVECVYM